MNRHNGYQQPEATANNANAKQWQIDVPEQGASKVGNYGNASDVNGGKNANDINHTSDQGEAVEVRVIKDDRGEPNNDEPGQVEQGGQAGQAVQTDADESQYSTNVGPEERSGRAVQTDAEAQPRKRRIIELLGSSPLGIVAQAALDSVRHSVHEIQVDRQIKLIDRTVSHYNGDEAQQDYNQLNQLVDEGKIKLSDGRVLKEYLERIDRASSGEVADSNTEFVNKFIQEDKIDLSKSEAREEYLKVALSFFWNPKKFGVQEAISTGKLDLNNEETADQFLEAMNEDDAFNTYGINLLETSGISSEKIVDNEHIQQLAIERMRNIASETSKGSGAIDKYQYIKTFANSYLADVLDKVCSDEEGRRRLKESIDTTGASVQELGESSEVTVFDTLEEWSDDQIVNIAKYNNVLRKLGWQPFGEALLEKMSRLDVVRRGSMLHGNDLSNELALIQDKAQELGLITPDIVDRLYTNTYHKLLDMAKKGEDLGGESGYIISPNLLPSGNDSIANYWYEQSKFAGGDAMRLCMKCTSDAIRNDDIPDTSEFIKEDGTMQDAFFRNRKGSLLQNIYAPSVIYHDDKNEEVMKLLEAHENQASEADGSKAMINMLSKMKDEDGKYDIEAMRELQLSIGRFCTEAPDKLFDEGKPTDEFYSLAFKQSFHGEEHIDKFMSYVDSDWKDRYGDVGRKYLELVSTYPSWFDALSNKRTEWIKNYLDAGGPTNELFDEILLDRDNITIFGKHPEWQVKLADDKKSLVKFCEEYNLSGNRIREYGLTADNLAECFDANGPTRKMKEKILFKNVGVLYRHPELQEGLTDAEKSAVEFCEKYDFSNEAMRNHRLTADNLSEHFDANGPMPWFLQKIFLDGNYGVIYKYYQSQDEAGRERMGLDDKWLAIIDGYGSVGEGSDWNSPHNIFGEYVSSHYDELTAEQIRWTADIITRLANSNASELTERSDAFTRELLKLDSDKIPEALTRIEDIYIHNHLPYVGKSYLVFRTMHPSANLENDFDFGPILSGGRPNTISPVLQQATGDLKSGKLDQMLNSRDTIIISDLLRASLGSNNRSIREYLTTLKNGQTLLDQLSSGELEWSTFNQPTNLMDKDTKASYDTLSTFAWHLATIYNSTLLGKEHPYQLIHQQPDQSTKDQSIPPNALQADFTNLTSLIKPNSRYTLADRAVRYFAHFVGIEDLAGAERYMDNVVKEADARNRRTAEYLATTSDPKLQPGDLVKGMGGTDGYGIRYLSYAFQNGSISKEYLGDSSRSDTTPLDADASIVLYGERTINQTMDSMLADDYGCGLWAVLRSDEATGEDRFIVTRRDKHEADQSVYDLSVPDANFDRTNLSKEEIDRRLREIAEAKRHRREGLPKLEAFATGVDGDGHCGIRTGFGMDKVSYYISDRTIRTGKNLSGFNQGNGEEYTPVSEVTKLEIALGGFYIPIIDRDSEELIFTPADYDKMREQMSGLSYYHTGDYQFAPDSELELPSTNVKETVIPGTSTIISELPTSMAETDRKHEVINQAIKEAITNIPDLNLSYKDYLDGDLTENIVEVVDTGSTGRQTNAPGSGDFDYIARLDRSILNDPTKKQQITDALLTAFGRENDGSAIVNGNLRLKQVSIDGLAEPVDIDITFTQKTNKVQYSTDMALADRLTNIKQQSEAKYQQVLANIIHAKQFLKAAGAYKPRRSPEAEGVGGLRWCRHRELGPAARRFIQASC